VTEEEVGHAIIGAAIKVHSVLGPGLLESAYETCLLHELEKRNLPARRQALIAIRYEDLTIYNGYRIDLLVADRVGVELKTVETILPVHRGQLLSYLRLGSFKLGCLLNSMSLICAMGSSGWSMACNPLSPSRILRALCGEALFF
jgi:GxxExxY protein